jgi:hypothetical protein
MFISLCNATVGLSLPSHDTLAVLTTQSTFLEWSFVYSGTRCCVQEHLNNGVFCSRIFLLCASLKYDHILTVAADTGIWHAVSQPKQIESVRDCPPKLHNSTWGYAVISTEGILANRLLFLFFFCYECYEWWRQVWWIINYKYFNILYNINKIINTCIVLTARTPTIIFPKSSSRSRI